MKPLSALEILAEQEYEVGELLYHRAADSAKAGIVTGICIRARCLLYLVTWGETKAETWHHSIELTREYKPQMVN